MIGFVLNILLYTIKLSALSLYLRLFSANKRFKLTVYVAMGIVVATALAFLLVTCLQCIPLRILWQLDFQNGHCINIPRMAFIGVIVNALTDVLVLCLPLPLIWRLHLPLRKKIGVTLIFASGGM